MGKSEVRAGLYSDDKSVEFAGERVLEKLTVRFTALAQHGPGKRNEFTLPPGFVC
jgi:hypothetical protein